MKKIIPIGIVTLIAILGIAFYLFTSRFSQTPYAATSPTSYNTTPSPATTNLALYTSDKFRFTLDYPRVGLDPQNNLINCGKYISENKEVFAPNDAIVIDNVALIEIVNFNKSIDDYINSQGAQGLYNTSKILSSGADDAVKIDSIKTPWTGEGFAPMANTSEIYQKDGKLFLIQLPQNFMDNGCVNPKFLNAAPSSIDKDWDLEDHLRFY